MQPEIKDHDEQQEITGWTTAKLFFSILVGLFAFALACAGVLMAIVLIKLVIM